MTGKTQVRPEIIWLFLVIATIASWYLTEDTKLIKIGATAVILIAAIKIDLVISHFMELRWHHQPWRLVLYVWLAVVTTIIIGSYWAGDFA